MKMIKLHKTPYGTLAKHHNARLEVAKMPDTSIGLRFTVLSDDDTPRAHHEVVRGKIINTSMRISKAGAIALMMALAQELNKQKL
jgi:hypothetical protein